MFGYFFHWRTLAWINIIFLVVPTVLTLFLHESPLWLIHKGYLDKAKESLRMFCRYHPRSEIQVEKQYQELYNDYKRKTETAPVTTKEKIKDTLRCFIKPTAFKPLLLTTGIFIFQEGTGIYIILVHTIIFFKVRLTIIAITIFIFTSLIYYRI